MGAAELVGLPNGLLHLEAVENSESNIINEDRLDLAIHSLNEPVHAVEQFHLHAPLTSQSWVYVKQVEHISGSENSHIGEDVLNLLLTKPLSP